MTGNTKAPKEDTHRTSKKSGFWKRLTGNVSRTVSQAKAEFDDFKTEVDKKFANAAKNQIQDPQIKAWINGAKFNALENYCRMLEADTRNHSYFCDMLDLTVNKHKELRTFINNFKEQIDVDQARELVKSYYEGEQVGIYQLFAKGQNLATRFFGFFAGRASTVEYFDRFALEIGAITVQAQKNSSSI